MLTPTVLEETIICAFTSNARQNAFAAEFREATAGGFGNTVVVKNALFVVPQPLALAITAETT